MRARLVLAGLVLAGLVLADLTLASALLAFTFSFDDFILSFFVSGVGSTTLPLNLFSRLRFGVSPIINAVAATMLTLTLTAIVVAQLVLRGGVRRTRSVPVGK